MNREQWLTERRNGICSTDAPAICNLCPESWGATPYSVFLEKRNTEPPAERSLAPWAKWGLRLEPALAEAYEEETGRKLAIPAERLQRHATIPWMMATPDRLTEARDRNVELKVVSQFKADEWGEAGSDQIPDYYQLQVQHQMAVLGVDVTDVAALIGGLDFRIYTVERSESLIRFLTEIEQRFWERVQANDPPEPTWAHPSTPKLIAALYGYDESKTLTLGDDEAAQWDHYQQLGKQESAIGVQRDAVKAKLLHRLEDASAGLLPDGRLITRKIVHVGEHVRRASSSVRIGIKAPKKVKVRI